MAASLSTPEDVAVRRRPGGLARLVKVSGSFEPHPGQRLPAARYLDLGFDTEMVGEIGELAGDQLGLVGEDEVRRGGERLPVAGTGEDEVDGLGVAIGQEEDLAIGR